MAAEARRLLEELMGAEALGTAPREDISFTDRKVCREYLCGLCPHTLFTNTRMDLGPCPKIHSEKLKEEYEKARKERGISYDDELERTLEAFVRDCDRRIESARRRLEKPADEIAGPPPAQLKEIEDYADEIETLVAQVERFGQSGRVEEALRLYAKVEELLMAKRQLEEEVRQRSLSNLSGQEQKLRACDICGAFLSILDSDSRLADHFGGKLHLGFEAVRNRLKQLREARGSRRLAPDERRPEHRDGYEDRRRSYDHERRRSRYDDRYDDRRSDSRYSRSSHRDQSRSRDRYRYRDRSPTYERRY